MSCDICLKVHRIDYEFTYLLTYLLTYLHGLFKEPIIGPLKSKMAEIRHLENRHDVFSLLRVVRFG